MSEENLNNEPLNENTSEELAASENETENLHHSDYKMPVGNDKTRSTTCQECTATGFSATHRTSILIGLSPTSTMA